MGNRVTQQIINGSNEVIGIECLHSFGSPPKLNGAIGGS